MIKYYPFLILLIMLFSCGKQTTEPVGKESPTELTIFLISQTEIQLSWIDNSDSESGFLIQRKFDNEDFETIFTTNENVLDYIDDEVEPLSQYYYRVATLFEGDQSEWSNVASIYTHPTFQNLWFGEDETFEIMTWNLEHFPKNNSITVDYVKEIILALDVDLIALQEIENQNYFNLLVDSLTGWEGYRATGAAWEINLALLYKTEVITMTNIYEIYEDLWEPFPRTPLVIEFVFDGITLIAINNHLKAGGDAEDEERRREASLLLEQYIDTNFSDIEVILLGDLNDDISEPEASNVFWNFIELPDKYLFTDMEIANGNPSEWSYPGWPSHLDHILITNELFDDFNNPGSDILTIKIDEYLDNGWDEYDENISDHRPVALKLNLSR